MPECKGSKKDGSRCRAEARNNSQFCFFHDPELKQARLDAQRRGGSRGTKMTPTSRLLEAPDTDFSLNEPQAIVEFLGYAANRVVRGQLDSKSAYALGYLADCALRAYNVAVTSEKIDEIAQLQKAERSIPVGRPEYLKDAFEEEFCPDDEQMQLDGDELCAAPDGASNRRADSEEA